MRGRVVYPEGRPKEAVLVQGMQFLRAQSASYQFFQGNLQLH